MKLLQVSNKIPFVAKDGGALAMNSMLNGFIENGTEVTLLAMNTSRHFIDEKNIQAGMPENMKPEIVQVNTHINVRALVFNYLFKRSPFILDRFYQPEFAGKLKQLLIQNTFDIIQLEGLYLSPYLDLIKKNSKALIAYRSHNIENSIWQKNAEANGHVLKKMYLKNLSKRLYKAETALINKYHLLVPITEDDARFYHLHGNIKPVHIAPFGIDVKKYVPATTPSKNKNLFYIGSLDWRPNFEGLMWFVEHVWPQLKKKYPGIEFKVAGRNASASLIKFFKKYQVNYQGEIPESKTYFLDNHIMIVPLFAGSGMRVKIIEGMAFGKTIVTTEKGAEGIMYQDNHNLCIANTVDDFSHKISNLLENDEKCNQIGLNARKNSEANYNNTTICKGLLGFYKSHLI